jgi:hypothetical protein
MSIKHATFDDSATVAAASITASFVDLLSLSDDIDVLFAYNTTDAAITLSIPNGRSGTKSIRLPAQSTISIDCRSNSKRIAKGTIQVKYSASAPTSGEVTITVVR